MNSFLQRGVELQEDSCTLYEANSRFDYSCILCCTHGFNHTCERCPIEVAHNNQVEIINMLEKERQLEMRTALRNARRVKQYMRRS